MHISPSNPVIKKVLQDFLSKELYYSEQAYDYDNVVYKVEGIEELKQVRFSFKSNCSKYVLENGGQEMIDELYGDYKLPESEWDPDFDVTLTIDASTFPKTHKIKKSMDEETQNEIRASNEEIKQQKKVMVDKVADQISQFKKDFLSAPIRKHFKACVSGDVAEPVEVAYRKDEKYWVSQPEKGEVQIYFAVNFTNEVDKTLARVILLEFQDSQRKVKSSPTILFHDKDFPTVVAKAFPNASKTLYSNGILSFKMTNKEHLSRGIEQPLTFLAGFRQYIHYHLHAIKTQLHTRMRSRVDTFERVIGFAKRDQDGPKNWKETHGGESHEDRELKEEKKEEEVFKFKN